MDHLWRRSIGAARSQHNEGRRRAARPDHDRDHRPDHERGRAPVPERRARRRNRLLTNSRTATRCRPRTVGRYQEAISTAAREDSMHHELKYEELSELEALIDRSITERYESALYRALGGENCRTLYTPADDDDIRDLLNMVWGELLTEDAIETAVARLCKEDEAYDWYEAVIRGETAAGI